MSSKAKKPRKKNCYKMAAPIPAGHIVQTNQKKAWEVGTSIGKGGFGEIYCCTPVDDGSSSKSKKKLYPHVMKIEPQENGPLFVEMHFYIKICKKEDIENWMKSKGIKRLGMPYYICSGSFEYNTERYRFIVMDRYGQNLWSIFEKQKVFPCSTALQIGLQIVDVLEYIHDQGYAHCDVKGSNLLLGTLKGTEDQVYLVDFGLASRYTLAEFKPDSKQAHNGTIEYTSRDAHLGVITRRGDMEILGFNLLHWITGSLPWQNISDPKLVEEKKKILMENDSSSNKLKQSAPPVIIKYLNYVSKLKYNQAPDYNFCRDLFKDELKKLGMPKNGKLTFEVNLSPKKSVQKSGKISAKRVTRAVALAKEHNLSENENNIVEVKEPIPQTRKKSAKNIKDEGSSWKDCASAKASNVVKAGEYISNPKPSKRQKKE